MVDSSLTVNQTSEQMMLSQVVRLGGFLSEGDSERNVFLYTSDKEGEGLSLSNCKVHLSLSHTHDVSSK